MKAEKKRVGTKAQIRAMKEKERRITTAIFLIIILLTVGFSAYFTYAFLTQSSGHSLIEPTLQFKPQNPNPLLKAAIVDHLSLTCSNETFREEAAAILVKANYTVDYFSGEKVTVEFYRNLPTYGYSLIILRVHSGLQEGDNPPVIFFTSELYSTSEYLPEQLTDQLWEGQLGTGFVEGQTYFGISPEFVKKGMKGKFQNTTLIMMGCNGLTYTDMAEAFVEKGAKVYMGWNGSVSAGRTDTATAFLLQHLIQENQTIEQAMDNTMKKVGPDPTSESVLDYYPLKVGEQTIENSGTS
jgi:hypothetical protein